jgi:hypothetical protein
MRVGSLHDQKSLNSVWKHQAKKSEYYNDHNDCFSRTAMVRETGK